MDPDHPPAHAGADEVNRVRSEPAPEDPVKGGGHSAPYDVAEDCCTGLEAGVSLNLACELADVGDILAE